MGGENDLFKTRTMTADEITEIGIPGVGGGLSGLIFKSGDELYSFMLRPLLPAAGRASEKAASAPALRKRRGG